MKRLVLMVMAMHLVTFTASSQVYTVAPLDRPKCYRLDNGNLVFLKPGSQLKYFVWKTIREWQLSGEAYFKHTNAWDPGFVIHVTGNKNFYVKPTGSCFISSRINATNSRVSAIDKDASVSLGDDHIIVHKSNTVSIEPKRFVTVPERIKYDTAFAAGVKIK